MLAADEFGIPTGKRRYADPHTGEHEAHDVLAADEFAMPGGAEPHVPSSGGTSPRTLLLPLLAVAILLILLRRR